MRRLTAGGDPLEAIQACLVVILMVAATWALYSGTLHLLLTYPKRTLQVNGLVVIATAVVL